MSAGEPGRPRRVADWKQTILVVLMEDLQPSLLEAHGLTPPAARLRPRAPRLAALAEGAQLARVGEESARLLRAEGVTVFEIGYHRGSDALSFTEIGPSWRDAQEVEMGPLLTDLTDGADDDTYDRVREEAVDAVLRILSEGAITERALIVAALTPPLDADAEESEALAELEALDPSRLPEVDPGLVDRVATHLARQLSRGPRPPSGANLPPEARRAYQRKAAAVGLVALAALALGVRYAPMLAAVSAPVVAVCAIVIAIHALALRQERGP